MGGRASLRLGHGAAVVSRGGLPLEAGLSAEKGGREPAASMINPCFKPLVTYLLVAVKARVLFRAVGWQRSRGEPRREIGA